MARRISGEQHNLHYYTIQEKIQGLKDFNRVFFKCVILCFFYFTAACGRDLEFDICEQSSFTGLQSWTISNPGYPNRVKNENIECSCLIRCSAAVNFGLSFINWDFKQAWYSGVNKLILRTASKRKVIFLDKSDDHGRVENVLWSTSLTLHLLISYTRSKTSISDLTGTFLLSFTEIYTEESMIRNSLPVNCSAVCKPQIQNLPKPDILTESPLNSLSTYQIMPSTTDPTLWFSTSSEELGVVNLTSIQSKPSILIGVICGCAGTLLITVVLFFIIRYKISNNVEKRSLEVTELQPVQNNDSLQLDNIYELEVDPLAHPATTVASVCSQVLPMTSLSSEHSPPVYADMDMGSRKGKSSESGSASTEPRSVSRETDGVISASPLCDEETIKPLNNQNIYTNDTGSAAQNSDQNEGQGMYDYEICTSPMTVVPDTDDPYSSVYSEVITPDSVTDNNESQQVVGYNQNESPATPVSPTSNILIVENILYE